MCRDVLRDDGTGSYDRALADMDARQKRHAGTDPDVVADLDRKRALDEGVPFFCHERMLRRIGTEVRTDEAVLPYRYLCPIHEVRAMVHEGMGTDMHIEAVVHLKRRPELHIFAD